MAEEGTRSTAVPCAAAKAVVRRLAAAVEEIAAISDFRNAYRKPLCGLSRRIKLLTSLLDELGDCRDANPEEALRSLLPLEGAFAAAKELLRLGSEGSKIFLVLERDKMLHRFLEVTTQLEEALDGISFDKLEVSDEVREQVELLQNQFRRAKDRIDMPDDELYNELLSLYEGDKDTKVNTALLGKLAEGLQLMTISDLKQESLALHEMVVQSGGDHDESIEKMSMLLKKIKDFVQTQNPDVGGPINQKLLLPDGKLIVPAIPDEFRCPISLELMKDPVIVATGQTYERSCIEKWIASRHDTCPKTQQRLPNTSLTPNYVLRSLIAQWCEANGMEPPRRSSQPSKPSLACSSSEHTNVNSLLCKLSSSNLDDQRAAAGELRLLAKRNVENRICIAEAGAIPLLINLLSSVDNWTQEHAVTALLNLSIYENNKASIMKAEAVPGIIYVLIHGSMEARENAAATLFSLSVVDENKVIIGASGAIPALVSLLSEGTQRGKKDAATALFNLCIYQGNKGKAVRAGLVPLLVGLLTDPAVAMLDEAMAVLAILSSHQEGIEAISDAKAVPVLVEMMGTGSPRNRENAAAILLNICSGEQQLHCLAEAEECGIMGPLRSWQ